MTRLGFQAPLRFAFHFALALGVVSPLSRVALANGTAPPLGHDRPRLLYRQAEAAFRAGKYEQARKLLLEAWGIRKTYDVAAALGQSELELKLYRDAAEHLSFAVQNFAPMESERVLEELKGDLRAAKSQVVEARIVVSEPRAIVAVNGKFVGESPLPASVFLEPGSHAFDASLGQDRKASKRMQLERGGTYDIRLMLPSPPPSQSQPQPQPQAQPPGSGLTPAPPDRSSPSYLPAGLSAAGGGVALLTGMGLLLAASSKDDRREDLQSRLTGTNSCGPGAELPPACAQISTLAWDASHFRTGALVSFGAALGAGVLTYLLWPTPTQRPPTALQVSPSYSYSHDGRSLEVSATGRF